MEKTSYDFIVVGGGTAGCAIAANLAAAPTKPSVLLIEAGSDNPDHEMRVEGKRWITLMNPRMNWGYKTVAQEHCDNRELDYSRGKGLGGSSAINFSVFSYGSRDDYNEWARLVGDDAFSWDAIRPRFKRLENFHSELPKGIESRFAAPNMDEHGTAGPLNVGYATEWERDLPSMLDVFEEAGLPVNPDHNSGNPIGMSAAVSSSYRGVRSTAKDLVTPEPENLTVVTLAPVHKVILEGGKAVGVESNGKKYLATKEVILSAGSLDAPKILMHSGIGPRDQLEKFGIPVIKDLPSVGQGLRDHMFCSLLYKRKEGDTDRLEFYGDDKAMDEGMEQWRKDGTGPWAKFGCQLAMGYFKLDGLADSAEFKALPEDTRMYLESEAVPHYELASHGPVNLLIPGFPRENLNHTSLLVFAYNSQSRGAATLQSADPNVPLLFDPRFLSEPFDRRVAIESLRSALRVTSHDAYARNTVATIMAPAGDSDEELLAFWRQSLSSNYHATGTVKMGKAGDPTAAVDPDFRVVGIEGLRVADMSVAPVLPNGHTQAPAYVIGMTCAEKIIAAHGL